MTTENELEITDPNHPDYVPPKKDDDKNKDTYSKEDVDRMIKEATDKVLGELKSKLDNAYTAKKEAEDRAKTLEEEKRALEIERLKEQGKEKEAAEAEIKALKEANEKLEKRNVELTRDNELTALVADLPFRSDAARKMALKDIKAELVKDDKGNWVHKSGDTMEAFVKTFSESPDNEFLFKAKEDNGGGSPAPKPNAGGKPVEGSVFGMSQADVLKAAAEGKLPNQNR